MSQSGNSLAQKSGTLPDRQNPRAFYSCRFLMPPSSQVHLDRPVTPKSRDCGTKEDGGAWLTKRPHSLAKGLRLGLISSIGRTSCGNFPSKLKLRAGNPVVEGRIHPDPVHSLSPQNLIAEFFRFRKIFWNFAPKNSENNNERKKPNENERK